MKRAVRRVACVRCARDVARGIDQVRTCRAQNGFRILEQHGLRPGDKVLKFPAFVRGETSLIVLVEEPVKPCLALDVESLQLDRYGGFYGSWAYIFILFDRWPGLYRGRASLSNAECRCKLPHTPDFPDLRMFCYARTRKRDISHVRASPIDKQFSRCSACNRSRPG